jgi:hypothetical protein
MFVIIIFICGFFAFNMAIAVLKTHYGEMTSDMNNRKEEILEEEPVISFKISILKSLNQYDAIKVLI